MTSIKCNLAAPQPPVVPAAPLGAPEAELAAMRSVLQIWSPNMASSVKKSMAASVHGRVKTALSMLSQEPHAAMRRRWVAALHTLYAEHGDTLAVAAPKTFDKLVRHLRVLDDAALGSYARALQVDLPYQERVAVDAAVQDIALNSPDAAIREHAEGLAKMARMVPLPPLPPQPVRKRHVPAATLAALKIPTDIGISEMRDVDDALFYVSNSRSQGGYGKFRLAMSGNGHFYAVKEFRTEKAGPKENLNKHDHRHTHVTRIAEMQLELDRINTLSSHIKVKRVIDWHGKEYAVMTLMTGELADALTALPPPKRAALASSALLQMAQELKIMHDKRVVHGDIKLHNALWDKHGTVTLTDFGFALPMGQDNLVHHGSRGTYMPPEMLKNNAWGPTADTWSLGACLTDAYVDAHNPLFFLRSDTGPNKGHLSVAMTRDRMDMFAKWRRRTMDRHGHVRLDHLYGDPLFSPYFSRLAQADGPLCKFIVERMLDPDPHSRAQMPEVIRFAQEHLSPHDAQLAQQSLEELSYSATNAPVLSALDTYRTSLMQNARVAAPLWPEPKRRGLIWRRALKAL